MAVDQRTAGSGSGLPVLGLTLPQFSTDPGAALAAGRDAHRLGFAGVFVFDHMWPLGGPRTRAALECSPPEGPPPGQAEALPRHIKATASASASPYSRMCGKGGTIVNGRSSTRAGVGAVSIAVTEEPSG